MRHIEINQKWLSQQPITGVIYGKSVFNIFLLKKLQQQISKIKNI